MGWGQILTLKNDPICNFALRVVTIYKLYWELGGGQILTLRNDPKLHWDGIGVKF